MKDLLFTFVFLLTVILFVLDHLIATAGSPEVPTDCAEEDLPVAPTLPAVTWTVDKDGRLKARKK